MTIDHTHNGAVSYRQAPDAPWKIEQRRAGERYWHPHSECATAEAAQRKIYRLVREELRRKKVPA